ncbi:hypothetical protein ACLB2K_006152 [Fragaria x ananassa]
MAENRQCSGHSGSSDFSFSKANPVEISPTNEKPVHSVSVKLERSKTESTRPGVLSKEAAKIFDNKIPVQQKVQGVEARPPGTLEAVRERPFGYPEGVRYGRRWKWDPEDDARISAQGSRRSLKAATARPLGYRIRSNVYSLSWKPKEQGR